ncbi:MAG: hypothetical protein AUJ85_00645 [Elusimicrobia bacterium CG1_02_37_114]|nr:MAG: hypothetical protein AUJ85_00645 [Elusimicrobia bacterium CG1_02_37_114]PIV52990.1 MAG: multidrug transporter [Elusimicrobia bacterium CG02_land_8_20_14_3_00_37_13]PIZ14323.1 MAG: multidrug transporter [Elusimicrobia bacterium CG_4_10_14_0_8_um_filter_37_32]
MNKVKKQSIAVILAAGHGKRIKSETPKVAHTIWGIPSVLRVSGSVEDGLGCHNQVIVIGQKANDVMELVGKKKNTVFAYQKVQRGTGHALQTAVKKIPKSWTGNVYVFPGDTGLLKSWLVNDFRKSFENSDYDMMLLSGTYEGPVETNYYGRIVRVPESGEGAGEVIEILQHKDILKLNSKRECVSYYHGKPYAFTKTELLKNNEFDSGILAFRAGKLMKYINKIKAENVQGEIYMTDLVSIFNKSGLKVGCFQSKNSEMLLGFNNKSTLKKMESIVRQNYYEILKDIISIEDEEDFFIAEEVINDIIKLDKKIGPLDIFIGSGCYISKGVKINKGITIGRNACLDGNIILSENVKVGEGVHISTYPEQTLIIGRETEMVGGNIIKGNTTLGDNVRIETGVNITGSDEFPVRIGDRCLIKGTSYIFGSIIEPDMCIQHSVLVKQRIRKLKNKNGEIQNIKYILPKAEGMECIQNIGKGNKRCVE